MFYTVVESGSGLAQTLSWVTGNVGDAKIAGSPERNSQGGFISTQDTVVALQALAVYENYNSRLIGETDLTITASGPDFTKEFRITKNNKLLNQRQAVKTVPSTVQFKIKGSGCALLQVSVQFYSFMSNVKVVDL